MKLRMSGAEFRNTGKVDFTSFSRFGESSYVIFARKGFWNEGEIAFGICTNQTQSIPFVVASFGLWINRGKMIFQKGIGSMTELYIVGKSAGNDFLAITNNGSICLYNTHWNTNMDIKGHGCVAVGSDSRLEISFARGENAVQNTQTIYLESPASVLAISGLTSLLTPPFINIAGFGQHNWIDLDIEFNNLTTEYDYFGHSGLLVIKLSKRQVVQIQIGESYDLRYLKLTSGPAGSRLVYELPSPNTPPSACSCKPIC
ncbi:hypothetical protein METBIDRAFT_33875 [Metschnikowia bicuspidata var. bicuspidata NRRL YB-4993]|uniref:Hyphally-regulated cell wall protein N-terminal domain-containing protein n=1 Tax=Metschnikowia bicuspidata var. bicuspidata NRRL YB-4993 TaxID=869754 RepID=A0A1A0GZ57_9ASCO|nr:hypothetical protein METBIDRAFT_33875 [Metschnikowia bicuspidata var. bicuspidata NRRL YB-4993]OBA16975.1 hypothetical protein METBIDRAFT_33875 [Metschnikowia bicuspidata var. bicuspidata NRRL YB-4993]